jgi:CheY-like chemotaxis protein
MAANLEAAEEATHEATQLARQLMGLSNRGGRLQLRPLNINDVVHGVTRELAQSTGPLVQMHLALQQDLWDVPADAAQLRQVVMNLCMNAVDAMPAGGTLSLLTENLRVARGEHQMPPHAEPGDFARLTVQDDGVGMDAGTRERVFEPFFTTKAHQGNQGLGLAMAYGAIQKHGGWMTCESEPGKGSRFHVYLLRTEQRSEPMTKMPASRGEDAGAPCILVVDDEAGVRRIAVSVLNRCGYDTIQAGDGEEALHMFRGNGTRVDLVLLDLSMPKLSGRETFLELKRMQADVPVLLCSGYPISLDEFEQETGFRPDGVIQKPFNVMGLGSRVGEILGRGALKLAK